MLLQSGEQLCEDAFALEGWGGVAVVETAVVGRDYLVTGRKHLGVDETLEGIGDERVIIDGFEARFGNFEHDGPVGAWFGRFRRRGGAVGEFESGKSHGVLGLVVRAVI